MACAEAGMTFYFVACLGTVVCILGSVVASPLLPMAPSESSILSWTSAAVAHWRSLRVKSTNMQEWEKRSRLLEQKFPQLSGLIDPVEEGMEAD